MRKSVYRLWWGVLLVLVGCSSYATTLPVRIALLAPFEGRHREVGYQALYAVRLAIAETERTDIDLLAVDDGGTVERAMDRAAALNRDPLVRAVVVLGPYSSTDDVGERLQVPVWDVGVWDDAAVVQEGPFTCGDVCFLPSFVALMDAPERVRVVTDSPPVTEDFAARYATADPFAPEPLPIAAGVYAAMPEVIAGALGGDVIPPERPDYTYQYEDGNWVVVD